MRLSGWGRYPVLDCRLDHPRDEVGLRALLAEGPLIARGNGRSYGDSALNPNLTVSLDQFGHFLDFDPETGDLTVEAGVMLADVIKVLLPRGWFPMVTPGTKFVTIGGMIAADVHGKNHHHVGSFGNHLNWIDLLTGDGTIRRCSRDENPELFHLTIGGMGLTGVILRANFRLQRVETGWIRQKTITAPGLEAVMDAFEATRDWTYTVAWIDCLAGGRDLGRSLLYCGEHARLDDITPFKRYHPFITPEPPNRTVPMDAPGFALNGLTVRLFNQLYYGKGAAAAGETIIDWDRYFYPLDAILEWNRIYGARGFAQYQCVIPLAAARSGIRALLESISAARMGSFLAVLKLLGPQDSRLSFPMEGYTLALDFPATPKALALLERLDAITLDHGGRLYLAKDSRLSRRVFAASEQARLAPFRAWRAYSGAADHFQSLQSWRLDL